MKGRRVEPFASQPSTSFAPNDLQLDAFPKEAGWTSFTEEFQAFLGRRDLLPSPKEENGERQTLIGKYTALTHTKAQMCSTYTHCIKTELKVLGLASLTPNPDRLKALLGEAYSILEKSELIGTMHRGAPWIGGTDNPSELTDAIKMLRKQAADGERFLQRKK